MWWDNCLFLPAEGKNASFSPDFTQPGKSLLEIPCTYKNEIHNVFAYMLRKGKRVPGAVRTIARSMHSKMIMDGGIIQK